jgi:hypothetical protein
MSFFKFTRCGMLRAANQPLVANIHSGKSTAKNGAQVLFLGLPEFS